MSARKKATSGLVSQALQKAVQRVWWGCLPMAEAATDDVEEKDAADVQVAVADVQAAVAANAADADVY